MTFSSKFIQRGKLFCTFENNVPAPLLRKVFEIDKPFKKAEITVCGLGFYELYVNGVNVTKGKLAPYISNPDHILYYDNYDITARLTKGKNAVGLILGNGFLNNAGAGGWEFDKAPFRDAPKAALALEVDGALIFEADETFKTADSPITFDALRLAGERYDARKEVDGWSLPGFNDGGWDNAAAAVTPLGEPKLTDCEPIRVIRELKPVKIHKCRQGHIYSFAENVAGICRLKIKGAAGQKIVLTHGELLVGGEVSVDNICFKETSREYAHKDVYICKGGGAEIWEPRFTYHGFQYVLVQGITDEQAAEDLLTCLVLHSDVKSAGGFECSDGIINKLQENTRRSTLSNFHYFLTDCPQREKNGWTGDAALSAEQAMLNFHAERSLNEWLNNIILAQKPDGQLPGIVPNSGWGYEWGNGPAWDTVIVQLPYYIYKYTGDKTAMLKTFPAIVKYLGYAKTKLNGKGLLAYGLGDWCEAGIDHEAKFLTALEITDTLTIMDFCYKAAKIAGVLGDKKQKAAFDGFYNGLRNAFRKEYICGGRINDGAATQTAVAMSLYYKAFEKSEEKTALKQLLSLIEKENNHFKVGILGARVLFRVLSDYGCADLAFKLIAQPTFPSYAYHLTRGATTLWENFMRLEENEILPLCKQEYDHVLSMNHHFWGDISAWFYKYIAGIRINPGLNDPYTIEIKPHFIAGIDYVKAERDCPGGKIVVEWKRENGKVIVNVSAPKNCKLIRNY